METSLPSGTVTFLFTDIEGSTRLWEQQPQAMEAALSRHDALAHELVTQHGGTVVKHRGEGDSLFAVFSRAVDAAAAVAAMQSAFQAESWPERLSLQVRMALHTGDASVRTGDYFGAAVNRCARLRAVAHGGQILLSAATQELVRDHLPEGQSLRDLGECRLRDLGRPERVFQLLHPALPAHFPPLRGLDSCPNNLSVQPTTLIGRDREVQSVEEMLRGAVRLVTLTGPGGTGKTRLALQIAADLLDDFGEGVFFVDLAPLRDPSLVPSGIAQVLGVRESSGQSLLEAVKSSLREKQVLLVLDNYEHLLSAATVVAELLSWCPHVKVLATSRELLRLQGEHEYPVPSLALPDRHRLPPASRLTQYASVELFIQRARAAKPDFTVTNQTAPAVAEICYRLDGLPLAVELAAARIRLFSPDLLLSRLADRLKLLTGGARDLPARQQTLRGTISWSYDLLTELEQTLFRRLSVFVGGCTLEAIEAVCDAENDLGLDVLDGVASLVGKSLLRQDQAAEDEPRFRMLETIREYAWQCVEERSGEASSLRWQHARFFLALVEQEPSALARLEREYDNLRAAIEWSRHAGDVEIGLRLAVRLSEFWSARGFQTEGRQCLAVLLGLPGAAEHSALNARALLIAGGMARAQCDYEAARALHLEGLAMMQSLGNRPGVAQCFYLLGLLARERNDYEGARSFYERCLVIRQELEDQGGIAHALNDLGYLAYIQGDYQRALSVLGQSLAISRTSGERYVMGWTLSHLGEVADAQGDYESAMALLEESALIWREMRHDNVYPLQKQGRVAQHQGDWATARSCFAESLVRWRKHGNRRHMAECLEGLATCSSGEGEVDRGARLFGAAAHLREIIGAAHPRGEVSSYERDVADTRATLGEEAFAAAWAAGRAMSLEEAVEYALRNSDDAPEGSGRS